MSKWHWSLLILAVVWAANVSAEDILETEKAAVKQVLAEFSKALNAHDAKKMGSFWANDGDLVTIWGQMGSNRTEIEQIFAENNRTWLKNANVKESIEYVHFIKPDVVTVDVDRTITGMVDENGKPYPVLLSHGLYILVKKDGKWQIAAFRSYFTAPPFK